VFLVAALSTGGLVRGARPCTIGATREWRDLQYLAAGFSEREIRNVFGESARMLAFFAERAGVPYPAATYSQALVARTVGQEMAGLSVVSEDYGRALLGDPSASGLLAHELAHQWSGNMVTCRAWTA
jgi:aminopeptidase N